MLPAASRLKPPLRGEPGMDVLRKTVLGSFLLPVNETIYYNMEDYLSTTAIPTPVPNPGFSRESTLLTPSLLGLPCHLLFRLVSVFLGVICSE